MKTWLIFLTGLALIGALTTADVFRKLNRPSNAHYALDQNEDRLLAGLARAYRFGGMIAKENRSIDRCASLTKLERELCWEGFAVQTSLKTKKLEKPPTAEMAEAWSRGYGTALSIAGQSPFDPSENQWTLEGWAFDQYLAHGLVKTYMKCFSDFSSQQRTDCTRGVARGAYLSRAQLLQMSDLAPEILSAYQAIQAEFTKETK